MGRGVPLGRLRVRDSRATREGLWTWCPDVPPGSLVSCCNHALNTIFCA
jgi:hypothetical protein